MTIPPDGSWPQHESPRPGPVTRPAPLSQAVKLMYLGAVLAVLSLIPLLFMGNALREAIVEALESTGQTTTPELVDAGVAVAIAFGFAIGLIGAGLWVVMAVFNGRGRKWARVTATVLGVIGILVNLTSFAGVGQPNVGFGPILGLLSAILAGAVLYLIWRPANNLYYEANSRS